MHTIDIFKNYYIAEYKVRQENDFWIAFFPDTGDYYATNEIGVDILLYFDTSPSQTIFEYIAELYGDLTDSQIQEIEEFINKLIDVSILERRN